MAAERLAAKYACRNVVYLITCNVNGKLYVGQTRELLWDRWRGHRNAALGAPEQSYKARTAIGRAMRKYGVDCFVLSVLEICANPDDLDAREAYWIAALGTLRPRGYNLTAGGNTSPRVPEIGAAISAANKGRVKTPEWRAKLSAAHKGKIISAEQRAGISARHLGSKHSEETKRKRSPERRFARHGSSARKQINGPRFESYQRRSQSQSQPIHGWVGHMAAADP